MTVDHCYHWMSGCLVIFDGRLDVWLLAAQHRRRLDLCLRRLVLVLCLRRLVLVGLGCCLLRRHGPLALAGGGRTRPDWLSLLRAADRFSVYAQLSGRTYSVACLADTLLRCGAMSLLHSLAASVSPSLSGCLGPRDLPASVHPALEHCCLPLHTHAALVDCIYIYIYMHF